VIYVFTSPERSLGAMMESRIEPRIVWPALAGIAIIMAFRNRDQLRHMEWPPHILFLIAYMSLAGVSALWAFDLSISLKRFIQQLLIITSVVVPPLFAYRRPDILRATFICYAIGGVLNVFFVLGNSPEIVKYYSGFPGYFMGKNSLGEFAAAMFLLSLHEFRYKGLRRFFAICIGIIAINLLVMSDSKTAFALALLMPPLAALILFASRQMRISPAIVLSAIPIGFIIFSAITGISTNRISYMIYGDSSFTGRTVIWEFAKLEISQRPLLGWGYQSFWLVGPTAPSVLDAPGWVKHMPNAHNGYYDTLLETGYIGLILLLGLIFSTVHVIGRVANRDPVRAWGLLLLVLYVSSYNFLESLWFRGYEFLWILFLLVIADTARLRQVSTQITVVKAVAMRRGARRGQSGAPRANV
jgi:O-antigen ligase